jgi:asparagine synthase (glutamine-hydrolysing)
MGRNNGVNNGLGYALTPFIDANIVPDANAAPIRFKNSGRLEAAMIRHISPALARYDSVYGHDFAGAPPLRRILKDMTTLLRPPELRRYTYRWHKRTRDSWPYFLRPPYLDAALEGGFAYMGRYFAVDRVMDAEHFARLCTLEYLFRRFRPDLPG